MKKFVEFTYNDGFGKIIDLAIDIDIIIAVKTVVSTGVVTYTGGTLIDTKMWSDDKKVTYWVNLPYKDVMNKIERILMYEE